MLTTDEKSLLQGAILSAAAREADAIWQWACDVGADLESPIERLMAGALIAQFYHFGRNFHIFISGDQFEFDRILTIVCQKKLGPYVADFVLVQRAFDGNDRVVVIECDGHDFHERTKEQAAHDRKRDRWMASKGYHVLRFTGSEIWKDAESCAAQVEEFLVDRMALESANG